jgi:hypothetical protein
MIFLNHNFEQVSVWLKKKKRKENSYLKSKNLTVKNTVQGPVRSDSNIGEMYYRKMIKARLLEPKCIPALLLTSCATLRNLPISMPSSITEE